jgi:glycosyltransferase involved in cell wall biosynthesis
MKSEPVTVSVALCTCNGEHYLRAQIDSILAQTRPVDEIVVGDDVSTDRTMAILQEYEKLHPGLFQILQHPSRLGTVGNFESALRRCSGRFIFLSDQDDIWKPHKVETMLARFASANVLMVFTDGRLIDSDGRPIGATLWQKWHFTRWMRLRWRRSRFVFAQLIHNQNKVTGATVALRRELLADSLPMRMPPGYWHDCWLALHAAARGGLVFLSEPLIDYRVHDKQQVGIAPPAQLASMGPAWSASVEEFRAALQERYPARAAAFDDSPRPFLDSALGVRLRAALRAVLGQN